MDLSRFDTRQRAQEGVDIPLEIDGEVKYGDDDKPITFRTRGYLDPDVRKVIMKMQKSEPKTPEEADENEMSLARAAIIGWSDNFTVEGEQYSYSKENIAKVLAAPVIRSAVVMKVFEQHRFMNGS